MSNLNGFLKLHRGLLNWGWYQDYVVKDVFLHLLLTASFKDTQWKGIALKRGQVIIGAEKLADELGFSRQQVRTALNKLKSTNEITIEATNKFSLITIVKWDFYQSETDLSTNKPTNNQPTDNQQSTNNQPHRKNINNDKNDKEIYISDSKELKSQKHKYGEYNNVLLTDEEYDKLKSEYSDYESRIDNLSSYIASTGKKYKSHYATIRNWAKKETPTQSTNIKELKKFGGTYL